MGKHHFRVGVLFGPAAARQRRCIKCKHPIVWGERCEEHKRELRQRQRRKPR